MKITTTFRFERATKNTYRYQEIGDVPVIGVLYIQKAAAGSPVAPPQTLNVTVESV